MSTVAHECSLHGCYIQFTQLHVLITLHSCKALALKYKHITLFLWSENCWHWALKLLSWWRCLAQQVKEIPPPFVKLKNLPSSLKPIHGPLRDQFQSTQDIRFSLQCGWVLWYTGMISASMCNYYGHFWRVFH